MARLSRSPRKTNASIKGFYQRHRLLRSRFAPSSLKLTMMGFARRGGVLLRQEKLRRKVPKQLRGAKRKTSRLIG